MLNRRKVVFSALAASACSLPTTACTLGPSWTLNYRLKLRLHGNGKTFEGFTVLRSVFTPAGGLSQGDPFVGRAWGEALVVDCAEYGLIFGILGGLTNVGMGGFGVGFSPQHRSTLVDVALNKANQDISDSFGRPAARVSSQDGRIFEWLRSARGELHVPVRRWPLLVQFQDLKHLETACLLAPIGAGLEFPSSVNAKRLELGVQSVTIEMTNESPSNNNIVQLLPWVRTIQGNDGRIRGRSSGSLAENLSLPNFQQNGVWKGT